MTNLVPKQSIDGGLTPSEISRIDFALGYYRHLIHLHSYVNGNIDEPFQLSDVAADIGISTSRLSHIFIEKTGISYTVWIRHVRIQNAQRLLTSGDRPITDIAYSVGYENVRTFERSFKMATGQTASEFRETTVAQQMSPK